MHKIYKSLSVVIPVHNENWCIYPLYNKISSLASRIEERMEIVFVNDCSEDNTAETLDELAQKDKMVKVINLRMKCGITAALMAGIDYAAGEIIVTMDGNLQSDPEDIPALMQKIHDGFDVCAGWRQEEGEDVMNRDLPNAFTNKMISFLSGIHLHDHSCSLKAFKKDVVFGMRLYGEMHRLIPVYASWYGAKITEIPVKQYPRAHGHGKKQGTFKQGIKTVLDLILVQILTRYTQRPMYLFGIFGILNFLASFISVVASIYYKFYGGKTFIQTPLPIISAITFMMGCMSLLLGFLAEIVMRTYFEATKRSVYMVASTRNIES